MTDAVQLEAVGIREPHVLRRASPATAERHQVTKQSSLQKGSFGSERKGFCERRCEKGRPFETFQGGVAQAACSSLLLLKVRRLAREGPRGQVSFCLHWQVRAHGHDFLLAKGMAVLEAGYLFRFTVIGRNAVL